MSKCWQIHIRNRHPTKNNYTEHTYLYVLNDDDLEPEITLSEVEVQTKHIGEYKSLN